MLESLGLDPLAERVYLSLVTSRLDGVSALAEQHGVAEEEIRRALDTLSALSLIRNEGGHGGGILATSPQSAVELLLARQEARLAEEQSRVQASRAAAAQLMAKYAAARPEKEDPENERLVGIDAIRSRLTRLGENAQTEVTTFAPGGPHSAADIEASRGPNSALLARGVRVRTVYLDSVHNHRPTLDHLARLAELGAQVRTAPSLPTRLIIVDRRLAVLPMDLADAREGAVVIGNQGTLAALCALFETVWSAAAVLGAPTRAEVLPGLSRQEAEALQLLASGLTDEAIARRLGVSPRTARRLSADLMDRLEAQSRFEAGVRAVQRGWLPAQ